MAAPYRQEQNLAVRTVSGFAIIALAGYLTACDGPRSPSEDRSAQESAAGSPAPAATTSSASKNFPTEAYFGDTHVHTGWSADAGMDGATLSPADAYRYALGMEVISNSGLKTKLEKPYDWFMVTDHSDGMGTINEILDGNPDMMESAVLKGWNKAFNSGDEKAASAAKSELVVLQSTGKLPKQIMDPKWMKSAWVKTVDTAEKYNQPGKFSTFIAFEWTVNADGGNNLHRNIIFRDGADKTRDLTPLTTFVTEDPLKLWEWMENYEAATGGQVLAIPHNGNLSNGRMFEEQQFDGTPMTAEYAAMRARYEPLFELTQFKGQSESHPSLSPNDEFANWDLWDTGNLIGAPKPAGAWKYEYWREALKSGMRLEAQLGTNPFQMGADGGTDTHTGLSSTEEDNFFGKFKSLEPSNVNRWSTPVIKGPSGEYLGWQQTASGITGVWASENTREAIWDAMKRKETFATTGPRSKVRFFGGFDFSKQDFNNFPAAGYTKGVPMGQRITGTDGKKPLTFLVAATKDPDGANLDRIQIIKGWLDAEGNTQEKVFDVVWSGDRKLDSAGKLPAVGNTVNLETGEYTNSIGEPELTGVFSDPEFDPALKAFYYVRVLEIPTPRWTLFDKLRLGAKLDDTVPLTHQERAFSSPIWYAPPKG
ncbi:MAG: DUF3604 domain-containing protein [Gammaproteobacteria bacterium]